MGMHDGGLAPAYNLQITADAAHGLIADVAVVNDPQGRASDRAGD